jgi:ribosomal protein S18 acetylase RimI-like enzyme
VCRLTEEVEVDIEDITEANLSDIPASCQGCVYWECPEEFDKAKQVNAIAQRQVEFEQKKREWFIKTKQEFGTCGKIVYHEGKPVAYAQYGHADLIPNVKAYNSVAVGKREQGVVFISCLYVSDKTMRGRGIGEALLKTIVDELRSREFKAIETFARRGNPENPSGPLEFYIRNGFIIKDKTNPEYPLVTLYL